MFFWIPPHQASINSATILLTTTAFQAGSNIFYGRNIYHQLIPDTIDDWITFPKALGMIAAPITLHNNHLPKLSILIIEPIIIITHYTSAIGFYTSTKLLTEIIANFDIHQISNYIYIEFISTTFSSWVNNTQINSDLQCSNDESTLFNSWANYTHTNPSLQCSDDEYMKLIEINSDSWINDIHISLNSQFLNAIYTTSSMMLWGAQIAYDTESSITHLIKRIASHEYLE